MEESPQIAATTSSRWHFPLDLVPPFRFATVEEGLYRGAYPTLRNFPFLKNLGIRTIVSLTPEPATYDLKTFCKSEGIALKYIPAERHKGDPQLLPTDLNEALHIVVNADNYPVYMHCLDGRHVIGLAVMAIRKLQCWDTASMQLEYERFTGEGNNETAFISDYGGGITLPHRVPNWLLSASWIDSDGRVRRHPTLKVKQHHAPSSAAGGAAHAAAVHHHHHNNTPLAVSVDTPIPAALQTTDRGLTSMQSISPTAVGAKPLGSPVAQRSDLAAAASPAASKVAFIDVHSIQPIHVPQSPCLTDRGGETSLSHKALSSSSLCIAPSAGLQMLSVRSALCATPSNADPSRHGSAERFVVDVPAAVVSGATTNAPVSINAGNGNSAVHPATTRRTKMSSSF